MATKKANPAEGSKPGTGKDPKRKRVPIHESRGIINTENRDPNYVYRWVNDQLEGTRIQRFLNAGYEFVAEKDVIVGDEQAGRETPVDSKASRVVGEDRERAKPLRAYLMRIPRDWYEEDQAEKQKEVDKRESKIMQRRGLRDGSEADDDLYYGNVKIKQRTA